MITPNDPALNAALRADEGVRRFRYLDTRGHWTIGVGHNLDVSPLPHGWAQPLSDMQIAELLAGDIRTSISKAIAHIPFYGRLTDNRQRIIIEMLFNMGWGDGSHGLSSFKHTLLAIRDGQYSAAADGMLASEWAKQVGARATRLATQMRNG